MPHSVKHYFVIETPEQLRAASDPLRIRLITMLIAKAATGTQLAEQLQMAAAKIHYHLRELESHGFVEVVRTEEKNGIIQKFFRATAVDFVVSERLLPSGEVDSSMLQEVIAGQLRMALTRVYETEEDRFKVSDGSQRKPLIHDVWEVHADKDALLAWQQKYQELMAELALLERDFDGKKRASANGEDIFFLINVGFLTNIEGFQVDEMGLPQGYDIRVHPETGEYLAYREATKNDRQS